MRKNLLSFFAVAVLMLIAAVGYAQTTFTKITSASELEAGANYLIVAHYDDLGVLAMGKQNNNNRKAVVVSENGESITVTPGTDPDSETEVFQFTLGGSANAWTFFDEVKGGYLYAASSNSNHLKTQTTLDSNGQWAITFGADGTAEVVAQGENTRNHMRFNPNTQNNAPLFGAYSESSTVGALVSFYKAGGAPVIDVEPTNYPTNFGAVVDGVDVTLNWTDAIGDQLPSRYLVVGSTGDITVPTDGSPVANGDLVMNVNYGVETVSFNGLEAGTTYHFAIFPYTNSGENIDYKTDGTYPMVHPVTANIHFLLNEGFDVPESLGVFTAVNVAGEQGWIQATHAASGTNYAYMNGFADGAPHANEDWLVSPAISGDGFNDIFLEFRTAMKFDGNPLSVKLSLNYNGNVSSATWEDLTDAFDFSTGNYEWVESGRFNIGSMVHGKGNFYIAFVYTCTDDAAASWEVDYVKVTGEGEVSVGENALSTVSVYPNPAKDVVSFVLENDAQVSIFDMTGRVVCSMDMTAGQANLQIANFDNGVYFLNIRYADGKKEVARFVKL
ncbi:MAG: choice-of-anchor J domain-containing protein [Bacteroidales bacterium]|nr:choice-of-anchor J domain-containing protein [Bacteroidales bacterium]